MLIDSKKYSVSLKKLWQRVFGDSEEYISLIFDSGYTLSEIFGETVDGEVVSALYLLSCSIEKDGKMFKGRYLYAAATLEEYRKQGIMGRLIEEAKAYADEKEIDFIALVPANENLYAYYGKYGFEPIMYNYSSTVLTDGNIAVRDEEITDAESILKMRRYFKEDSFCFERPEMKYALSCLSFAGYHAYRNSEDSYYISNGDKTEIIEYISSENNFRKNTELFISKLKSGTEIKSPYDLSEFCESKIQKYGMIYTGSLNLKECFKDGVYMNIALD